MIHIKAKNTITTTNTHAHAHAAYVAKTRGNVYPPQLTVYSYAYTYAYDYNIHIQLQLHPHTITPIHTRPIGVNQLIKMLRVFYECSAFLIVLKIPLCGALKFV